MLMCVPGLAVPPCPLCRVAVLTRGRCCVICVGVSVQVETKFITGLVKLVRDHIASMANDASKVEAQAHFDNSLQHIRQQCSTPEGKAIYGDIQLD